MATTKDDIRRWVARIPEGCTHMIVATDTFDYEDYPVYFVPGERTKMEDGVKVELSLHEVMAEYSNANKMSKVMEIYSFTGKYTLEEQLAEYRAWHFD
jgi:hypothetical protein